MLSTSDFLQHQQQYGPWKGHKYDVCEAMVNAGASIETLSAFLDLNNISRLELYIREEGHNASFGISEAGFKNLAEAIQHSQVTDLSVYGALGLEGAHALSQTVRRAPALASLAIFDAPLGDEGTIELAHSLVHNNHLVSLQLKCASRCLLPSCPFNFVAKRLS